MGLDEQKKINKPVSRTVSKCFGEHLYYEFSVNVSFNYIDGGFQFVGSVEIFLSAMIVESRVNYSLAYKKLIDGPLREHSLKHHRNMKIWKQHEFRTDSWRQL